MKGLYIYQNRIIFYINLAEIIEHWRTTMLLQINELGKLAILIRNIISSLGIHSQE